MCEFFSNILTTKIMIFSHSVALTKISGEKMKTRGHENEHLIFKAVI